ncbi:MAG: branched-chain amino acid ABC transporter permease [Elusimicrobia bacterium]|nr:branched-chain amino acid ABC transporter permease [Elusimicrobiota bacterium]
MPRLLNARATYWVLAAAAFALPLVASAVEFPYLVRVGGVVGLFMLLALGLNFTLGYVGLFDLGFIAFYAIGAYATAIAMRAHVPAPLAILLAVAVTVAARLLVGVTILRLRGDYLAVVTMGFGEIARLTINNLDALTNGPKGMQVRAWRPLAFLAKDPNVQYYLLIAAAVLLGAEASRRLEDSRVGRAWVAIREDEIAARLSGIPVQNYKLLAFTLSAVFAGLAGALFALWEQFVTPESFVFWESVLVVSIVVLGGMGSISGVLLGALILAGLPPLMQATLSTDWINYRYLFFGLILVLVTLFRPQGLLPSSRREAELTE